MTTTEEKIDTGLICVECEKANDGIAEGHVWMCETCYAPYKNMCFECGDGGVVACPVCVEYDESCPSCHGDGVVDCPRLAEHTTVVVIPAAE